MAVASGAALNFSGTNDTTGLVVLRSSNTGSYWNVNNASGSTVTPVWTDVEDSNATNAIIPSDSINSGHNNNWNFPTVALSSWSLDMTAKTVTLNFTDGVKASTLNVSQITLSNNSSASYTLTNSTSASADGNTVVINLSTADFNAIADTGGLCDSKSDSYITFTATTIKIVSNSNNYANAVTTAIEASNYTANTTAANYFRTTVSGIDTATTTAGAAITGVVIKTYDANNYRATGYTNNKTLLFSVAGTNFPSPNGTPAQAMDYQSNYQNFENDTTLNFSYGKATTSLKLYCETASGLPAQVFVTEDPADYGNPVTSINYDLSVTVNPAVKNKIAFLSAFYACFITHRGDYKYCPQLSASGCHRGYLRKPNRGHRHDYIVCFYQ